MHRSKLTAALLCFAACTEGNALEAAQRGDPGAQDGSPRPDDDAGAALSRADAATEGGDQSNARDDAGSTVGSDASVERDAGRAEPRAAVFDGLTGYVEIPDDDAFSEPARGGLTIEAWLRPDSLDMPKREDTGYVHWLGKGSPGQQEWVARMYQQGNDEGRENRLSFYAFNLTGGLGAGSYVQESVTSGEWIHYVGEFDDTHTFIFRDGQQKDSDLLSEYQITPENGTAPVRIGTRDLASFFQGAISRVAIYAGKLAANRVRAHAAALGERSYDDMILAEPSLVAFYKLDEASGSVAHDAKGDHHGAYHGGVQLGAAPFSR
jgi:hypothetical protein